MCEKIDLEKGISELPDNNGSCFIQNGSYKILLTLSSSDGLLERLVFIITVTSPVQLSPAKGRVFTMAVKVTTHLLVCDISVFWCCLAYPLTYVICSQTPCG